MSHNPVFDSVSGLARDSGIIGDVLNQLPRWELILHEADRCLNPWEFLLLIPNLPKSFKRLFLAGQSQRIAWMRIVEIAIGAGSIEKSWFQEMDVAEKAGDLKRLAHAREKVFRALWRFDRRLLMKGVGKQLSKPAADAFWSIAQALYAKTRRKHGSTKTDDPRQPANRFKFDTITGRIAAALTFGWLRNEDGVPGYCFFSDSALRDFLATYLRLPELEFNTLRKTRQFLRLRKAPTIIYGVKGIDGDSLNLLDRRRILVQTVRIIRCLGRK